jgi:predicted acetyltransferase
MAMSGQEVVAHAGIVYRVIRVGNVRVPVGGMTGVGMLPEWRGRGKARVVVDSLVAFVGVWLWAPFAMVMCSPDATEFYTGSGWRATTAAVWCEPANGERKRMKRVAMVFPCQGEAEWPEGDIDLWGASR